MARLSKPSGRPLPDSNAAWILEIAMAASILDAGFGAYAVGTLVYHLPRASKNPKLTPGALADALADSLGGGEDLDLLQLAEAYLEAHVLMGYLTQSEAAQIGAFVESNFLALTNVTLNLCRLQSAAKPKAAVPSGSWLQLKITLRSVKPAVWRRVMVPADLKLPVLHTVIQEAMGWYDSHLHQFRLGHLRYAIPDEYDDMPPDGDARKFCVGDLLGAPKEKLLYDYDFGDGWEHEIVVEKVLPEAPTGGRIACLSGKNACPPEDVGGPWGYERMRAALADPGDEEHDSYREWAGEGFDATRFDLAAVNAVLSRIKIKPPKRKGRLALVR